MAYYKVDASATSRERLEAYLAQCKEDYASTLEIMDSGYSIYDRDRRNLLDSADAIKQEILKVEKELDRRKQRGKLD